MSQSRNYKHTIIRIEIGLKAQMDGNGLILYNSLCKAIFSPHS